MKSLPLPLPLPARVRDSALVLLPLLLAVAPIVGCASSDETVASATSAIEASRIEGTYVNAEAFEPFAGATNLRSIVLRRKPDGTLAAKLGFRYVHPSFERFLELETSARVAGSTLTVEGQLQDLLDAASGEDASVLDSHVDIDPVGDYTIATSAGQTTLTMVRFPGGAPVVLHRR